MAHGQPDFGMYAIAETIYKLTDMGELAARLGSIVTHDRRGDVVWLDDFEDNINKWIVGGTGTGWAGALSTDYAKHGAKSAKLTTGDAVNNTALLSRYFAVSALRKLGIECSFILNYDLSFGQILIQNTEAALSHQGQIRIYPSGGELKYLDGDGNWQSIATGLLPVASLNIFHVMKLVVDFELNKYVRLIFNNHEYDLAGIDLFPLNVALYPIAEVELRGVNGVAANTSFYVDDAIITQNEP